MHSCWSHWWLPAVTISKVQRVWHEIKFHAYHCKLGSHVFIMTALSHQQRCSKDRISNAITVKLTPYLQLKIFLSSLTISSFAVYLVHSRIWQLNVVECNNIVLHFKPGSSRNFLWAIEVCDCMLNIQREDRKWWNSERNDLSCSFINFKIELISFWQMIYGTICSLIK